MSEWMHHVVLLNQAAPAASPNLWSDFLPSQRFVIVLSLIGCITIAAISIIAIGTAALQTAHRNRTEADLKRDMLDRGMAADDIAKVIESRTPESFLDRWASNQGQKKSA